MQELEQVSGIPAQGSEPIRGDLLFGIGEGPVRIIMNFNLKHGGTGRRDGNGFHKKAPV